MFCPLLKEECKSNCAFKANKNCLIVRYLQSTIEDDCEVSSMPQNRASDDEFGKEADV